MKTRHILSLSLLPISLLLVSCQDTPTTISTSAPSFARTVPANGGPTNIDSFDMNDRFSGSGAKGNGTAKVTGSELNLTIHARHLEANHPYEVHVIVGPPNAEFDVAQVTDVFKFPVTSDKNGKFEFKESGIDLLQDPGLYRLDYVVVHDFAAHGHDMDTKTFPTSLILACAPASFVTI